MEENPIDARIGSSSLHRLRCHGVKKLGSNPSALVLDEGCIDLISATVELCLNTSTLSSLHSLTIQLTSDLITSDTIVTLVDSGSTHCFIDSTFVSKHQLQTISITPILLWLFDGTTNTVIHNTVELPIHFTSGET